MVEQYRLTKQVKFIEHCKNMPLAYKISDFVVSSSIEPEAFGRISVEAQSMKKLIIASNIGGSKETIIDGKTGILFEAGNSDNLSEKIIKAINMDQNTLIKWEMMLGKCSKKFNKEKKLTYSEYKTLIKCQILLA